MTYYFEAFDLGSALFGLGIMIVLITFASWWLRTYNKQGSSFYRKYLTNLYVAGRIFQEAEKDGVNLYEVEKDFIKYSKLNFKERMRDLDDKIEEELMDKIDNKSETKSKKTETKKE